MKITILTICPEQIGDFRKTSLIDRVVQAGRMELEVVDIREFAPGCFRKVDDSPSGSLLHPSTEEQVHSLKKRGSGIPPAVSW